ncbi:MAG: NCS2 family permease [Propionibacteriaceae bacterium]|nr:NCS2 family permease [Propionibacteriaceae bacterium]
MTSTKKAAKPTKKPLTVDSWFEIKKRGSNVGREVRGGLVTFFTMAYIIVLNPIIIGTVPDLNGNLVNGMPISEPGAVPASMAAVAAATALLAGLLSIAMGGIARFPIAVAAGLGLNAMVAYTIVGQGMMSWPAAMGLVFWEGVIITILVFTGFRKAVFNAVPRSIRSAISVGIGLFIAFIGLVNGGIVRPAVGTPVQLGIGGSLEGWPIFTFVFALVLLIVLHVLKVKGAMLIAILSGTVLGMIFQAAFAPGAAKDDTGAVVNPTGWMSNIPAFDGWGGIDLNLLLIPWKGPFEFFFGGFASPVGVLAVIMLIFALMLADFFDTMGTIVAVGAEGKLLQPDGNPPRTQEILVIDSLGAVFGGLASTSSNTSYIESASGVGDGARTGLASITTGVAFLLAIFLAPLVNMVPGEAASPALAFVGFLMMAQVLEIKWNDPEEGIPAFFAIILMPFAYSITVGIGVGFILFVTVKLFRGKAKDVHPLLYVVAIAFLIYFVQGSIFAAILPPA